MGIAIAAMLAVCIIMANMYYVNDNVCSVVAMQINPMMEYSLNRKEQVVKVDALNDDADDNSD